MGEVFRGPGFRVCARAGCNWPAVAVLSFDYHTQQVWMDSPPPTPEPSRYDICEVHSNRFRPPYGWTFQDRRPGREASDEAPEMFTSDSDAQVVSQLRPESDDDADDSEEPVQNELFQLPGV